jgi:hypothetical protein
MIYAYCVRRAGDPPPPGGLSGLGDAPVRLIEEAALGFWVSEGPPVKPTSERLREHDRVVRAALRTATPLPIRYGAACFPTEDAAREALAERVDALTAGLERVAGRVEMGVRVGWDGAERGPASERQTAAAASDDRDSAGPGRAYLEARRREMESRDDLRAAAESALSRVEAALSMSGVPTVRTVLPEPGTAGILAHLLEPSEISRYRTCVQAAGDALPGYSLTVSGPWAPYSFA